MFLICFLNIIFKSLASFKNQLFFKVHFSTEKYGEIRRNTLQLKIKNLRNLRKGGNLSYKIEKDNLEE
jgi:hypothetical protein